MFQNKSGTRSEETRRRRFTFSCRPELLESRELLTGVTLDVGTIASAPLGVQESGFNPNAGLGWSVADVGDINGSGYDSFVVSSPSVVRNGTNVQIGTNAVPNVAYLIFGSQQVTAAGLSNVDWASLTAQGRIGDIGMDPPATTPPGGLGTTYQTNPTVIPTPTNTGQGFSFAGVRIYSGNALNTSRLGASVSILGDINGSGYDSFMIGAPGASDINGGNAGTGRAYVFYGGKAWSNPALEGTSGINVDNTASVFSSYGINIVTLESARALSAIGSSVGNSVGGHLGTVLDDGFPDIAVGAPGATVDGNLTTGMVYLVAGSAFQNPTAGEVINLDTVGQPLGTAGVTFTGVSPGDQAGFSLAGTNLDGATNSSGVAVRDLLIGAPQIGTGAGVAYVVYGGANLPSLATVDPASGLTTISLSRIGDATVVPTQNVPGVTLTGAVTGDELGYSVDPSGNFTSQNYQDALIGAPMANTGTGTEYVLVGNTVAARPLGNIPLNAIPATATVLSLRGANVGDLVGYSADRINSMNGTVYSDIAIGAPGYNGSYGAVYLIPGSNAIATTSTVYPLANVTSAALNGNLITAMPNSATNPTGSVGPAFFGASVSGTGYTPGTPSIDGDTLGDLIVGAPGYSLTTLQSNPASTARNAAGGVFALEGRFLQLGVPGTGNTSGASIVTTIGVGSETAPFTINAAKSTLVIYVFNTQGFDASTDINPSTIVVNGVAFPNAILTPGNGYAIITISPVSALGLSNGNNTITISGLTTAGTGAQTWTGSASALVSNASGNNGSGSGQSIGSVPVGFQVATDFPPPFGERLQPTLSQLVQPAGYQPLSSQIALSQFKPNVAYVNRKLHGITTHKPAKNQLNPNALIVKFGHFKHGLGYVEPKKVVASPYPFRGIGVHTLAARVFTTNPAKPKKHK